jgi:integrase
MKSYTEQHPIFDGAAMIYRAPASGDVWQFRTWIGAEKKYVRKTLKTRDLSSAIERGRKLYLEYEHNVRSGKKIFGLTARELADQFLAFQQERVNAGRITQGRFSTIKTQLNRHFLGFLGKGDPSKGEKVHTGELERGMFYDFAQYRRLYDPDVRDVTIRNEQTTLNALFKWAERKGLVPFDRIDFEEIKIRDIGRRDAFTMDEYRQLYLALRRKWLEGEMSEKEREHRNFIRDFILVKANTFMRFGELKQLKWADVLRFKKHNGHWYVEIMVRAATSKNRKDRKFFARGGDYFKRIKLYSKHIANSDYVFCDNETGKPISKKVYYGLWKRVLALIGLEKSERKLSYYSLRHFGITMRRYAGVSFEDLSLLAGTSFAFIENHYSHVDTDRLLEAATKGFTVDKDGFIVRDESLARHAKKPIKKSARSISIGPITETTASLNAKEMMALKRVQQDQNSEALGKSDVRGKPNVSR